MKIRYWLHSLSENSREIILPLLDSDRMIDELIEVINEVSSSKKMFAKQLIVLDNYVYLINVDYCNKFV